MGWHVPALAITHESTVTTYLIAAVRVIADLLNHVSRNSAVVDRLPEALISWVRLRYT